MALKLNVPLCNLQSVRSEWEKRCSWCSAMLTFMSERRMGGGAGGATGQAGMGGNVEKACSSCVYDDFMCLLALGLCISVVSLHMS